LKRGRSAKRGDAASADARSLGERREAVRKLGLLILVGNVMWFAACGGNGGSSNNSTVTAVSVSCSPSTITSGQTSQCTATVSGTGNFSTGVTWSASAGSISSTGLFTGPQTDATLLVTITATSTQNTSVSGTASITVNPSTSASNVAPLVVDSGPDGQEVNIAYTTVKVCVPGSSQCQTIDHIQVDTGSEGLRLLSSVLTISLPGESISGQAVNECLVFADGYVWGPVVTADVSIAGESASDVPIHMLIPSSGSPPVPSSCSSQTSGPDEGGSASDLGANGILGVGPFQQDCGLACTSLNSQLPDVYYTCSGNNCNPSFVPLVGQVPNPVIAFNTDNNGVLIQLPSLQNSNNQDLRNQYGVQQQPKPGGEYVYHTEWQRQHQQHRGLHHHLQQPDLSAELYRQRLQWPVLPGYEHDWYIDVPWTGLGMVLSQHLAGQSLGFQSGAGQQRQPGGK